MKNKMPVISASLLIAVLFTILFQSAHFTGHLWTDYFNKSKVLSYHIYPDDTIKITKHHSTDHSCSICEFTLNSIVLNETFSFKLLSIHEAIPYSFTIAEVFISVLKNSFGLRAPPLLSIG